MGIDLPEGFSLLRVLLVCMIIFCISLHAHIAFRHVSIEIFYMELICANVFNPQIQ